jgi:hypothetical protein
MKRLLLEFVIFAVATAFTAPAFAGDKGRNEQGRVREGGRRLGRDDQKMRG